jgi:hypothetical protein
MYGLNLEIYHPGKERLILKKRQGTPKLLAKLTTRKRREEELTGKRRDEELKGKRPAWGDPGRGRPFHPTRRSPPAAVSSYRPVDLGFGARLTAVDGQALDHMGSEEDGKRKNMAGNRERERGRGGSGLCRCRRCSMSVSQERASEILFFYSKGYASFSFRGIPRVRVRNLGTAGSYVREGDSEFFFVSRPQF